MLRTDGVKEKRKEPEALEAQTRAGAHGHTLPHSATHPCPAVLKQGMFISGVGTGVNIGCPPHIADLESGRTVMASLLMLLLTINLKKTSLTSNCPASHHITSQQ